MQISSVSQQGSQSYRGTLRFKNVDYIENGVVTQKLTDYCVDSGSVADVKTVLINVGEFLEQLGLRNVIRCGSEKFSRMQDEIGKSISKIIFNDNSEIRVSVPKDVIEASLLQVKDSDLVLDL